MSPIATPSPPQAPPIGTAVSGKWLIIGVVAIALAGAVGSWVFRYYATHQTVKFWGAKTARMIRDAPIVELYQWSHVSAEAFQSNFTPASLRTAGGRDISQAHGLVHLRNALLESQSFHWPAIREKPGSWGWVLLFRESSGGETAPLLITTDWKYVGRPDHPFMLSCEPISAGLKEVITEFAAGLPPRD